MAKEKEKGPLYGRKRGSHVNCREEALDDNPVVPRVDFQVMRSLENDSETQVKSL